MVEVAHTRWRQRGRTGLPAFSGDWYGRQEDRSRGGRRSLHDQLLTDQTKLLTSWSKRVDALAVVINNPWRYKFSQLGK